MPAKLRSAPFETLVVFGDGAARGMCATKPERRWANLVAERIGAQQGSEMTLHNKGLSSNVISPRSPGYDSSWRPSARDRYERDVIALRPGVVIISFGLCDMRCAYEPRFFAEDLEHITADVMARTGALTVLTTLSHMTRYGWYPPFDQGSRALAWAYNRVIAEVAGRTGAILADVCGAQGGADWLVHDDGVHPNDAGHAVIGEAVFGAFAGALAGGRT